MKNIFTFGIFLSLLFGLGNNVSGAQFTANTGIKPGAWNSRLTWYPAGTDTTVVANFPLPTYLDDVTIPAGDSIYLGATTFCGNINLSGTLCMYNGSLYANGDITVNTGGILSLKSNVYCKNLYNAGKVWAYNTNYNSAKILGIGFTNTGTTATTIASTDSITIVNDGIIGGLRSDAAAGKNGCGIWVTYSNRAKALNIKHSANVTSGFTFNVGGIYPAWNPSGLVASTAASQNFNLYIQESVALFVTASPGIFSLQNGDTFSGFNRTCTIASGDTVFVATKFHANGAAPGASQGNMTYNIYGCLDMGTYSRSKNEFDLYTSATSPSVTVNIGDGTLANAGTLVLGKIINLVKSATTGQTIAINPTNNSTVTFGFNTAPLIYCGVGTGNPPTLSTIDNTLFPSSFYNLTVNNSAGVTIPSSLRVRNALTLTSGKITLGSSNLTAGSISGGSSSSYVITSGTGALTTNASTSGTLFPIGTATGYAPVTITPATNDTVSAVVSATPTGTFTGYAINANEWSLTPQVATTAALSFTPTTATNTTSPVIFSGIASGVYAATTTATVSGSTYSASGISLPAAATLFATGGTTPATAVESNTNSNLLVYSANNALIVKNAKEGDVITVYGVTGSKVVTAVVNGDNTTLTVAPGAYIVKVGSTTKKVLVQ